jgi:hypothetical protein
MANDIAEFIVRIVAEKEEAEREEKQRQREIEENEKSPSVIHIKKMIRKLSREDKQKVINFLAEDVIVGTFITKEDCKERLTELGQPPLKEWEWEYLKENDYRGNLDLYDCSGKEMIVGVVDEGIVREREERDD